jgi:hypothetical protein
MHLRISHWSVTSAVSELIRFFKGIRASGNGTRIKITALFFLCRNYSA